MATTTADITPLRLRSLITAFGIDLNSVIASVDRISGSGENTSRWFVNFAPFVNLAHFDSEQEIEPISQTEALNADAEAQYLFMQIILHAVNRFISGHLDELQCATVFLVVREVADDGVGELRFVVITTDNDGRGATMISYSEVIDE